MALVGGAAALLLLGVWCNSWWSVEQSGASLEVGLREMQICFIGICQAMPFDRMPARGLFNGFANVTFFLGIACALGCVVLTVFRDRIEWPEAPSIAARLCLLLILCAIGTFLSFGRCAGGCVNGLSWGLFATIGGAALLAFAMNFDFEIGGGSWQNYQPPGPIEPAAPPFSPPVQSAARIVPATRPPVEPLPLPDEDPEWHRHS